MVKIRLLRMGRHKAPTFRLVAVDSKAKANGSYIELIGNYNPQRNEQSVCEYTAIKWLAHGAQPTDTAKNLLQKAGIWAKFTELKNSKKLVEYLGENQKQEPVVKKEKPKKEEKPKKQQPVKKEEPKEEIKEEPKQEIVEEIVEEVIEEPVIIEEEEEDEEDDIIEEEEAPEIETIVEEAVEEEIVLTKAINEVIPENGIDTGLVRILDETTVSLTAKTRKESNFSIKLPAITNYEINRQTPTKVEFHLEEQIGSWTIQKNSLVAKKVAILEEVKLPVLVTLWLNDNKLSFHLHININPADEVEEKEIHITQESTLVTTIDEKELKAREKQTLTAITSAEIKKSGEKAEIIMVSMHHKIIEEIINQEKTTLFSKRLPAKTVTRALIYCVKPIGTVIGEFTLRTVERLPKAEAWEKYGSKSALTKAEFNNYYHGRASARVMIIDGFIQYKQPKELSSFDMSRGPSGFRYLKKLGK